MEHDNLESLPKETLVELVRMYARNWQTLDGLWFGNVEKEFGLDAAVRIDLQNWSKMATIEARRLKKVLKLEGGLDSVLTALRFMSWQVAGPPFSRLRESAGRIAFGYSRCPIQESRQKAGKPEFPCKTMKSLLLSSVAAVIEPRARLKCVSCPPDRNQDDVFWCRWELTLD